MPVVNLSAAVGRPPRIRISCAGTVQAEIPESLIRLFAVNDGDDLAVDDLLCLVVAANLYECRLRAVRLLGFREQSSRRLAGKLSERGFGNGTIEAVLGGLMLQGLLDDGQVAARLARDAFARREGPRRVRERLVRAGIPPHLAALTIDDLLETLDLEALAAGALRRMRPVRIKPPRNAVHRDGEDPDRRGTLRDIRRELTRRFYVFLMQRGFPGDIARRVAERAARSDSTDEGSTDEEQPSDQE
jgi:SOS response regulatory protein OraA/RecX